MPPDTIEHDGRRWIEVRNAAKLSRMKAALIEEQACAGAFDLLERDGQRFILVSAANRLKRETATLRSVERKTRIGDAVVAPGRIGPISAHREKQDVLPISGGREGQGWLGQRKRD